MKPEGTLILTRSEIASLMNLKDYVKGVEDAFRMHAEGGTYGNDMLHADSGEVEFHIKSGGLRHGRRYFALKANASSFHNAARHNLPNIMGAILLFDGKMSYPLAILDSIEITIQRTGAATAVAAKHLARRNSHRAAVCGCGTQGRVQLAALLEALPITHACAWDREEEAARRYAREMSERLSISVAPVKDPGECIRGSDVIVACTPSREPYITREQLSPGCFISAIGADGPDKQELESEALRGHKLVVDILEQCARAGELHHAIENGVMARGDVYGTLGEVVSGKKPGRESSNEIIIFDATGTAIQDVAGAAACYEKALAAGAGKYIRLYE